MFFSHGSIHTINGQQKTLCFIEKQLVKDALYNKFRHEQKPNKLPTCKKIIRREKSDTYRKLSLKISSSKFINKLETISFQFNTSAFPIHSRNGYYYYSIRKYFINRCNIILSLSYILHRLLFTYFFYLKVSHAFT